MVREFEDIFHEDLPRLPASREDFLIDLELGMTLISKAYTMTPAELKELKEQI